MCPGGICSPFPLSSHTTLHFNSYAPVCTIRKLFFKENHTAIDPHTFFFHKNYTTALFKNYTRTFISNLCGYLVIGVPGLKSKIPRVIGVPDLPLSRLIPQRRVSPTKAEIN